MAGEGEVDWPQCEQCIGVVLEGIPHCWAHTSLDEFENALHRLGIGGHLDARGVTFAGDLLKRILAAAPHNDEGNVLLNEVNFKGATFTDVADFTRVSFEESATFREADFQSNARFENVSFPDDAGFET